MISDQELLNIQVVDNSLNQNEALGKLESEGRGSDLQAPSEVSRIFGKGASAITFEPVNSSTPTRDDFKRTVSTGSDSYLINDETHRKSSVWIHHQVIKSC